MTTPPSPKTPQRRQSALAASAFQRLGVAGFAIALLWLLVWWALA